MLLFSDGIMEAIFGNNEITSRYLCWLVRIMFSIPPNTGWVEQAYSILEMICQKRRNRMAVGTLKELLFLGVPKLSVKDAFGYEAEIDYCRWNWPNYYISINLIYWNCLDKRKCKNYGNAKRSLNNHHMLTIFVN